MEAGLVSSTWNHGNALESKIPYAAQGGFTSGKTAHPRYQPVAEPKTHSVIVGYLLWIVGFTGAHRFYYGKPLTGILWFFTFGLLGIGWIIDAFLIPTMNNDAKRLYKPGSVDFSIAWLLLIFGRLLGLHRFVQGLWVSGLVYLFTGGFFGIGFVYDLLTLNEQITARNHGYLSKC